MNCGFSLVSLPLGGVTGVMLLHCAQFVALGFGLWLPNDLIAGFGVCRGYYCSLLAWVLLLVGVFDLIGLWRVVSCLLE